jgi:hypothetical protein
MSKKIYITHNSNRKIENITICNTMNELDRKMIALVIKTYNNSFDQVVDSLIERNFEVFCDFDTI